TAGLGAVIFAGAANMLSTPRALRALHPGILLQVRLCLLALCTAICIVLFCGAASAQSTQTTLEASKTQAETHSETQGENQGGDVLRWGTQIAPEVSRQRSQMAWPTRPNTQKLGTARLFSNDFLGDGEDRWRTSSYVFGLITGPKWRGERPGKLGEIIEYRYRSEIFAPDDLTNPDPGDRPYAGMRAFGVHSHAKTGGFDLSFGLDLVFTGPQTAQDEVQTAVHDGLGIAGPDTALREDQIEDALRPTALIEVARSRPLGGFASVRPFVEATLGVEDSLRFGADVMVGRSFQNNLLVRDTATGHLIRGAGEADPGLGLVLGADFAALGKSRYLPQDQGYDLEDRTRLRAGVHWQGERSAMFYGLTWMSKEFAAQEEDQVLGSIRLQLDF
ncbi:MAG: lipid A-modifier LpxR family protein, partial [Pseudomonadota bacterium]